MIAYVSGAFDNLRSDDIRFLECAASVGPLTVALWSDEAVAAATGKLPRFPLVERQYFLESIRFVSRVVSGVDADFRLDPAGAARVHRQRDARGDEAFVVAESLLNEFPPPEPMPVAPSTERQRVLVTGSFDWFHTGHVRFFEEVSQLGDLYVVVGHDANIALLKGAGHPMFPATERCYVAGSIRFARLAVVSTGHGWLDAEPEIERLQPHIYAVNEDGDRPEKRDYCRAHGIEYVVLSRAPRPGLPARASTALRGF